jgi:hypothetical protein
LLSFIFIFLIYSLFSCNDKSSGNEILTSKIQYDVPVNNNDPQLDWWINNIEGSKREPFLDRIMKAVNQGDVKVYDYFDKSLTPGEVRSMWTDTIYRILMRTFPPYDEYDTMIVHTISYRDIVKIRFLEEWRWSPSDLEIEKEILAFGPVIEREIAGERFNELLFWIYMDEHEPVK